MNNLITFGHQLNYMKQTIASMNTRLAAMEERLVAVQTTQPPPTPDERGTGLTPEDVISIVNDEVGKLLSTPAVTTVDSMTMTMTTTDEGQAPAVADDVAPKAAASTKKRGGKKTLVV